VISLSNHLFRIGTGQAQQIISNKISISEKEIIENRLIDPFLKININQTIKGKKWENIESEHKKKFNELSVFINALKIHEINYINLKGLAMLNYYPSFIPRQSNDFDFLIENISDFWKCHEILITLGYSFKYNPMLTKKNNEVLGITKYYKKIDEQTSIKIEININSFIISELCWFNDEDLWSNIVEFKFQSLNLRIPSDEMNIIILVIEASDRPQFFVRDIVDFFYLYNNKNINEQYIINKLNDKYLISVFNNLKSSYLSILSGENTLIGNKTRKKRELIHVFPSIVRENNKVTVAYMRYLKLAAEKYLYQKGRYKPLKYLDLFMSPKSRFKNGVVTHFIQLFDNKMKFKWIRYKKYHILTTPIGIFLATNFAILDEDEEEEIKDYICIHLIR